LKNSATGYFRHGNERNHLIPVKGFRNAKQRLSPLLGAAERELAETMFRDVLREFRGRGSGTFVVTGDDRTAESRPRAN
jgi:2-phospho-L-lactate guanylyltransferase (CobY/MobA/RfbA family)